MILHRPRAARRWGSALVIAAVFTSAGCAEAGAETTCEDYLKMSYDDQAQQVAALYQDKHGRAPSGTEASGVQLEATVYCQTLGNAKTTIKEIPIS